MKQFFVDLYKRFAESKIVKRLEESKFFRFLEEVFAEAGWGCLMILVCVAMTAIIVGGGAAIAYPLGLLGVHYFPILLSRTDSHTVMEVGVKLLMSGVAIAAIVYWVTIALFGIRNFLKDCWQRC